jgi:hypothetical protein
MLLSGVLAATKCRIDMIGTTLANGLFSTILGPVLTVWASTYSTRFEAIPFLSVRWAFLALTPLAMTTVGGMLMFMPLLTITHLDELPLNALHMILEFVRRMII